MKNAKSTGSRLHKQPARLPVLHVPLHPARAICASAIVELPLRLIDRADALAKCMNARFVRPDLIAMGRSLRWPADSSRAAFWSVVKYRTVQHMLNEERRVSGLNCLFLYAGAEKWKTWHYCEGEWHEGATVQASGFATYKELCEAA